MCPYCKDVVLLEGFSQHISIAHDAPNVPNEVTEEWLSSRYSVLGGVLFGELDDNERFKPELTKA
jgi:hypothetical protein